MSPPCVQPDLSGQSGTLDGVTSPPPTDPPIDPSTGPWADHPAGGLLGDLVLAIDHVGVAVPDLDAAIAFYTGTLGLVVRHREVNEEQGVVEAMLAPASAPAGATQLQLLAPLGPTSTIARFLDRSGPGLQQLACRVDNVDHAAGVLRGKGIRLLYDAARRGTANSMINFVHPKDAGGVLIELVQATGSSDDTE